MLSCEWMLVKLVESGTNATGQTGWHSFVAFAVAWFLKTCLHYHWSSHHFSFCSLLSRLKVACPILFGHETIFQHWRNAKYQYVFGLHWHFSSAFGLTTLSFIWSNLSFSEICLSMFPFGFCSKIRRARLGKTKGFDKYKVTHQQIHQLMTKINPKHLDFLKG